MAMPAFDAFDALPSPAPTRPPLHMLPLHTLPLPRGHTAHTAHTAPSVVARARRRHELALAGAVADGDGWAAWLASMRDMPLCSVEEERALLARVHAGMPHARPTVTSVGAVVAAYRALPPDARSACDELWQRNLRLCAKPAMAYAQQAQALDLDIEPEDLLGEAIFGVLRAILKFDLARGCKFSTYAMQWIRQACTRTVAEKGRLVHIPVHLQGRTKRAELAALDFVTRPYSLDQARGLEAGNLGGPDDESKTLGSVVADPEAEDTLEQRLTTRARRELLVRLRHAAGLSQREWLVLALSFGLTDDGEPAETRTLEQVADTLATIPYAHGGSLGQVGAAGKPLKGIKAGRLTRERVRQIEEKALEKLRTAALAQPELAAALMGVM